MYDLFGSENDVTIIYLSQAWLPDSVELASKIVGAVHNLKNLLNPYRFNNSSQLCY